jgi:hyperosmotically inducible protein
MSNLKNTFGRIALMMSVALLSGVAAVAAPSATTTGADPSSNRTAGQAIDDSTVTAKIKSELIKDPTTKAYQIEVDNRKGVVQLNGFVESSAARMRAAEIAKNVAGVVQVQNNLEVKSGERTAGKTVDDAAITAKVKTALIADSTTKAHQINVTTNNGQVQLSGFVDSAAAREQAAKLALQVNGVVSVQNNIDVK